MYCTPIVVLSYVYWYYYHKKQHRVALVRALIISIYRVIKNLAKRFFVNL